MVFLLELISNIWCYSNKIKDIIFINDYNGKIYLVPKARFVLFSFFFTCRTSAVSLPVPLAFCRHILFTDNLTWVLSFAAVCLFVISALLANLEEPNITSCISASYKVT